MYLREAHLFCCRYWESLTLVGGFGGAWVRRPPLLIMLSRTDGGRRQIAAVAAGGKG